MRNSKGLRSFRWEKKDLGGLINVILMIIPWERVPESRARTVSGRHTQKTELKVEDTCSLFLLKGGPVAHGRCSSQRVTEGNLTLGGRWDSVSFKFPSKCRTVTQ